MKKIFLALLAILLVFSNYAQSNLIVFSEDGEAFNMTVDGSPATNLNASKAVFDGIKGDFVQTTITFKNPELGVLKKGLMIEPNMEITMTIKKNKKGDFVIRPVSSVAIENAPKRTLTPPLLEEASITEEVITSSGNTTSTTTTITETTSSSMNVDSNDPVVGLNMSVNINVKDLDANLTSKVSGTTTATITSTTSTTNTIQETEKDDISEEVEFTCAPMAMGDFVDAKKSISNKSFAEDKLTLAKQIIRGNCVSTDQVVEIMNLFSFEESKIEFAKAAYDKTTDKENYFKINDAFTYSSSINELNEFLEGE